MSLAGLGAVIVWNDIAPELREDFFEWHPRQHMPERLSLPGFLRGRRCVAVDSAESGMAATVEFFTLYEVADLAVLDSEIYKTRLAHPTEWSLKVMPGFVNNVRGGCRVLASYGQMLGGLALTIRLVFEDDAARSAAVSTLSGWLPDAMAQPRIVGVHLLANDPALAGGQVGTRQGRFISQPDVVLLLEGSTVDGLRQAADTVFGKQRLKGLVGAAPDVLRDMFRLEYSLQKLASGAIEAPSVTKAFQPPG